MRKVLCMGVLLCGLASLALAAPVTFQSAWESLPETWPATGYEETLRGFPELRAIYFAGPKYQDRATRVFAYYGLPKETAEKSVPGVVLVHGGGGTAFAVWVQQWVARGYAAIALDCNGARPNPASPGPFKEQYFFHEDGGPPGWGGFGQMDAPTPDHWVSQSVASIALAHTLLRSFPGVDPKRTAITGISWGGFLTCIAAGVDQRFACAAPVYGCGFIAKDSAWEKTFSAMSPEAVAVWNRDYDPSAYIPKTTMPSLWVNGTNDFAYWMENWQRSYRLTPGPRTLCMRVNMNHSHQHGWAPKEIAAFVDHHLRDAPPLTRATRQGVKNNRAWAKFKAKAPVKSAQFHYTTDTGPSPERQWHSVDVALSSNARRVEAALPEGTKLYFFTLTDTRGLLVSTEHGVVE